MLKSIDTPWSVANVKSHRTDWINDNGEFETSIGDDFDGDAGHTYSVDSTAIQAARFDPSDESLNITYRSNPGKEYKFQADAKDAADWLMSPSKGRTTQAWRVTHHYPGY